MTKTDLLQAAKPILFNTEMVRAIFDKRKTETRRAMKPQPYIDDERMWHWRDCQWMDKGLGFPESGIEDYAPCLPGDILWVRETWNDAWCDHVIYKADGGSAKKAGYLEEPKWRPSIHMPKEAARLFLRITSVRVERLQKITPEQALDEGVKDPYDYQSPEWYEWHEITGNYSVDAFAGLWDSTIKPADLPLYGWEANPWVWVIAFEKVEK